MSLLRHHQLLMSQSAPSGPSVTWSPTNIGQASLSNGNMTGTSTSTASSKYGNIIATQGYTTGKYYFEIRIDVMATFLPTIGLSREVALTNLLDSEVGPGGTTGLRANGSLYNGTTFVSGWTGALANGVVVRIAFDADTRRVWYGRNSLWINGGDPAAGTGWHATMSVGDGSPICARVSCGIQGYHGTVTARFRSSDFSYSPPSGFSPYDPA